MHRYRLTIEYDGTDWSGWQIQPDQPTVQEALETALKTALRTPVSIVGSGRTDAGVHATGQVAHLSLEQETDPFRLMGALNGLLPGSIAVTELIRAPGDFHARFDARRRTYRYRICVVPRPLERHTRVLVRPGPNIGAMNQAARDLLGTHDFDAFCRTASDTENRVCTVHEAAWHWGRRTGDFDFVIAADRFLHGMVRAVVGTLLDVGHNRRAADCIPSVLATRDRREAGPAAPARGLTLESVDYDAE